MDSFTTFAVCASLCIIVSPLPRQAPAAPRVLTEAVQHILTFELRLISSFERVLGRHKALNTDTQTLCL